jgi:hypothetical protein
MGTGRRKKDSYATRTEQSRLLSSAGTAGASGTGQSVAGTVIEADVLGGHSVPIGVTAIFDDTGSQIRVLRDGVHVATVRNDYVEAVRAAGATSGVVVGPADDGGIRIAIAH